MLPAVMNTNALPLSLAALFLLISACGETTKLDKSDAPVPKLDEVFRKDLLAGPAEDVRKDSRTAKDFPDLKVTTDKASKPDGDETLDYWETGSFNLVFHLASGKQVKNTFKMGFTEDLTLIEGVQITGLVFGCIGMKKGEIRNLFIPADLGYGEAGDLPSGIPSNATLLVRAELVEFGAEADPDFMIRRAKAGTGEAIRNDHWGQVNYTGVLADGEQKGLVFDSNLRPGRAPFGVQIGPRGQVVQGWQLGLRGMKVGERRWLKIPPHLAYGANGRGDIPPDATLIFEVELMSIDPGGAGRGRGGYPGAPGGNPGFPQGGTPGAPSGVIPGLVPGQGR